MRMTYDPVADAAYVYMSETGDAPKEHEVCGPEIEGGGAVILAYDGQAHLVGIEILGASRLLLPDTIAGAEQSA